ncbi:MAG: hypothetical protein WCG34_04410 [Leptolinea sp.]
MDWSITVIILQLIVLEGLLSLDNAAVLGALVSHLPDDVPISWPRALKSLGDKLHPLLGNERTAALRVGLLGAYAGRAIMLLLAGLIIQNPWLKVLGAAYLVRLAFDNLGQAESGEEDAHIHPLPQRTFWSIVVAVELTDLVFSLDNVVAAVALSNKMWVIMLGVAIGIVFMRFAAGWFSYLVDKEPVLKTAAYILVFNIGMELLLEHFYNLHFGDWGRFSISMGTIAVCVAYAHFKPLQVFRPLFVWLAQGMANINEVVDWLLVPFAAAYHLAGKGLQQLFPHNRA